MIPDQLDVACHLNVALPSPDSSRLGDMLDAVSALGYRRVVLPPLDAGALDVDAMRAEFDARRLTAIPMAGQSPAADVSSADPSVREAGMAAIRDTIELAAALGSDRMGGAPYGPFGRASDAVPRDAWRRSAAAVGLAADEAFARGITMTIEVLNRYETAMMNTAEQAMEYVAESGSDHLMLHLDTFHMAIEETDIRAAVRAALPRLGYIELGQSGRGPLAAGAVDIAGVVAAALDDGYRGRWGIEAFSTSVLPPPARSALAVWRRTYEDGLAIAAGAAEVIRAGWLASARPHPNGGGPPSPDRA